MILAMFVGFFQMRELKFEEGNKSKDKIIIVTAFGMFAYSTFTIIAGKKSKKLKFFCYFYPTMHMSQMGDYKNFHSNSDYLIKFLSIFKL